MGVAVIFRALGLSILVLGVAMVVPMVAAFWSSDGATQDAWRQAGSWVLAMIMTLGFGGGFVVLSLGERRASDIRSAILVVLLWWIMAPFFAAIPFVLQGAPLLDAYFEAVSALTTTGAWLSETQARADPAGIVWRALLQWIGGLASMSIAAAIFIRPMFIGIDTLLPPFNRGERQSDLRAVSNAVNSFFFIYAGATVLCFLALAAVATPLFDAGVAALSIMSSGGFAVHPDGVAGYGAAAAGVAMPFIFMSGANFILLARLTTVRQRKLQDVETGAYAIIIFSVGIVSWFLLGAGDFSLIPAQFFNIASLMSTNGYFVGEKPFLPLALVAVMVGGAAVSTAGGLKIIRWLVVFRRAREEIRRLVSPNAVLGEARVVDEFGVWTHFLLLTLVLGLLTMVIAGGGHSFEVSVTVAAGMLSNTGPVIHLLEAGANGYGFIEEPFLRFVMIVGMVLGRVETVSALALMNYAFWRS